MPGPLCCVQMCHRVANRFEAAAEIACELLGAQRLERVEHAIAGPVVVVEHRFQVGAVHGMILALMIRSSRGYSRSMYAFPPSNNGCWRPARMPLPEFSPY